ARAPGGLQDRGDRKIALARGRRTEPRGEVGHRDVRRVAVGVREDGDRLDAHIPTCAEDADGDLAAVGNEKTGRAHSGMLPCFLRGRLTLLPSRNLYAAIRRSRVSDGSMMSST